MHLYNSIGFIGTGFIHFSCLFFNCTLFGCFVPSGQVISVCVSTFTVFTTGLVDTATWAQVVFTELNISICLLGSVYEIPLQPLFSVFLSLLSILDKPDHLTHDFLHNSNILVHFCIPASQCDFLTQIYCKTLFPAVEFSVVKFLTFITFDWFRNKL